MNQKALSRLLPHPTGKKKKKKKLKDPMIKSPTLIEVSSDSVLPMAGSSLTVKSLHHWAL